MNDKTPDHAPAVAGNQPPAARTVTIGAGPFRHDTELAARRLAIHELHEEVLTTDEWFYQALRAVIETNEGDRLLDALRTTVMMDPRKLANSSTVRLLRARVHSAVRALAESIYDECQQGVKE